MNDLSPCPSCDKSPGLWCAVMATRNIPAETDDGTVFYITPDDITSPDTVEVELYCPNCGYTRMLDDSEWETA